MLTRWRLDELQQAVADALTASGYQAPENGQVSSIPSRRSIRYYSTLGLLDAPAEMQGRTALYDERHLLQLCAIKRMQSGGAALVDVQTKLAGLDDDGLRKIAGVETAAPGPRVESARRQENFWEGEPTPPPPSSRAVLTVPQTAEIPKLYSAVELADGLTLLVEGQLDERGAAVLKAAAQRLVIAARELAAPTVSHLAPNDKDEGESR